MYRKLILTEIHTTRNSTVSELRTEKGQFLAFVVEAGFRQINKHSNTRIPPGTYMISKRQTGKYYERYKRDFGHKFAPHLLNIAGFSQILMKIGNSAKNNKANLLVNAGIKRDNKGNWKGVNSTRGYKLVYNWLKGNFRNADTIYLEIKRRSYV